MQQGKYFKHSGAFGPLGLVYMLLAGALGAVLLGAVYGYGDFYIPIVFLNMLLVIAYGCCVGLCVAKAAKLGKVRNPMLILAVGGLAGVFAEYMGWVWWLFAYTKQELFLIWPQDVWGAIQLIDADGAWSVFDRKPTGIELYVYWTAEALTIIGCSAVIAWNGPATTPFCEPCGQWADQKDTVSPLESIADAKAFKSRLEQGDLGPLQALHKLPDQSVSYTEAILSKCRGCQSSNYLTVRVVTVGKDKKGKPTKSHSNLLENLSLSSDHYRGVKALQTA